MPTNTTPNTEHALAPMAWIGLDWGDRNHAFALQDTAARQEEGTVENSAELLHGWLRELEKRYGGRPVAMAVEANRGLVHVLMEYPWLVIYPVNPVTSARYRQAFTPSGASDDLPDARVLLELVRDHAHKLRPLEAQDPQTQYLNALCQSRRDMVDRSKQVLNQLTSLLKSYFPQALELVGSLNSKLAVNFLNKWPDLLALKLAKPAMIKRFYYAHNVRRPELVDQRLELIRSAVALTSNEDRVKVAVLQLRLLLDQLAAFQKHIPVMEKEIERVFAEHPEAVLFRDLVGAGQHLAPRLCAAFGTLRTLYPNPAALQKFCGVAPVIEKSGQQVWIHWRWRVPVFLRQTFIEWSGQTVMYSAWARAYYTAMKAKGKPHHVILRALAFKWIRVLWRCWQDHMPYDEARYLKQLRHRKSPYAVA